MITQAKLNSVALLGLLAGMGVSLPNLPTGEGNTNKNISRTPHQGKRECARRAKRLQAVKP